MSITAKSLKEILQVFKDFDITDVKFKTGELELECRFVNSKTTQPNKVPKTPLFPEAKYSNAIQSDVTEEELQALGFAGVNKNIGSAK